MAKKDFKLFSLVKAAHVVAEGGLQAAGYHWELRHFGEHKLGLWRKNFSAPTPGKTPRRLFVVPGFGDTPVTWLPVLIFLYSPLRSEFDEIVLFDFPGFSGFLNQESPFKEMDLLMKGFEDVCDELMPHTLLGHSLGGWLCAKYAGSTGSGQRPAVRSATGYRGPARVIAVNPAGVSRSPETRKEFEKKVWMLMNEGIQAWRPYLFANEPFWFRLMGPGLTGFLSFDEMKGFVASVRDDHSVERLLEHVEADVSLIWGEEDKLIPAACAAAWMKRLTLKKPRTDPILLKGIGHTPHVENPFMLARAIARSFRATVEPSAETAVTSA